MTAPTATRAAQRTLARRFTDNPHDPGSTHTPVGRLPEASGCIPTSLPQNNATRRVRSAAGDHGAVAPPPGVDPGGAGGPSVRVLAAVELEHPAHEGQGADADPDQGQPP